MLRCLYSLLYLYLSAPIYVKTSWNYEIILTHSGHIYPVVLPQTQIRSSDSVETIIVWQLTRSILFLLEGECHWVQLGGGGGGMPAIIVSVFSE